MTNQQNENTTILVTGGAGFIGSHCVRALLEQGCKVICVDNFNDFYSPEIKEKNITPHLENPNFTLYRVDISEIEKLKPVFVNHKIDKILHLAARAGVRPSLTDPNIYIQTNLIGSANLFELAREFEVPQIVFASSSSVYGNQTKIPFSEEDIVDQPISPYAFTKRSLELLAYTYHQLYDIKMTGLRFFTVYGEAGRPDMAPYIFTEKILSGAPIKKFGDGTTKRDYTYISDIVSGILAALDKHFDYEVINLGNNQPVSLNDFIATLEKITGQKAKIEPSSIQPGDVNLTYADISKAQRLLGYEPKTSIKEGLERLVSWFKKEVQPPN